jgi:tetratricopeptide (TPR) repeat protein
VRRLTPALLLVACLAGPLGAGEPAPAQTSVELLRQRWSATPDDVTLGIRLQDALREAGQASQARALFLAARRAHPDDLAVRFLYGRARGDERGLSLMREALAHDLGLDPHQGGARRNLLSAAIALAVAEVGAGHAPEAAAAAMRVTALRGQAADWVYLGWIRQRMLHDPRGAQAAYEKALRADEHALRARMALVDLLLDAGRAKDALALARRGVALHPDSAYAHLHLGLARAAGGRAKDALADYAAARRLAGRDAALLAAVASAQARAGNADAAREAYRAALAVDPGNGRALAGAGLLALDDGHLEEARDLLARAAHVRPRDARLAFLRGVCAQRMGLAHSAASAFRRAHELAPERVDYLRALALAYVDKGSVGAAVRLLERGIADAPQDADLRFQLGLASMKMHAWTRARDAFTKAAALDPKDARPWFYLAIIQGDRLGKDAEALQALRRYRDRGGKEPRMLDWLAELEARLGRR